jgi:hypothetical protein
MGENREDSEKGLDSAAEPSVAAMAVLSAGHLDLYIISCQALETVFDADEDKVLKSTVFVRTRSNWVRRITAL